MEQSHQRPQKLTPSNYYSHDTDWYYMSFSLFKDFQKCEAAALAKLKDEWEPTNSMPLLVGNYVHSYFESTKSHTDFLAAHGKDIMTKPTKKEPHGHLRSEFKVANGMIQTLQNDKMFNYFYTPGKKEVIVTGKIDGYWWKGKIDSLMLNKNYFCDLKTADDILGKHWIEVNGRSQKTNFIMARKYNLQMAIYKELIKQSFHRACAPLIFAVSKQDPPDKMGIDFDDDDDRFYMQEQMEILRETQERYWKIMNGEIKPEPCYRCEYCRTHMQLSHFVHASEIEV
ncbi:PD-(D/E)XK nuclease-like domain-containing protein [Limosilactobacillus oris]|uniref:PD-(D/E)XK nuclease-like domain-containing protein n=1 Tax=Limosilactobacillus oris TaxID=1632 RepID=UPI001884267D|nr:PD-(D/E)XK nuclease-like domain-containing protein [Limosilactobacillus oris]MBF0600833.1 PD-(D/E)XK nuclease-like domain-containing protein [Limosilactobacillus oris]